MDGKAVPQLIAWAATGLEFAGVAVIVLGAVIALRHVVSKQGGDVGYRGYRQGLGRAILLGLELLVGADIIRTVSAEPTVRGVLVLGLIVVVRTFLSFTLEVELEGRWPWQRRDRRGAWKDDKARATPVPRRPGEPAQPH